MLKGISPILSPDLLEAVSGFYERFFLYMEDVDVCRRMLAASKLLYWPGVTVEHVHQMGHIETANHCFCICARPSSTSISGAG